MGDVYHHLAIGEVRGERIGCYLLWITDEDDSPASYHSLATSKSELIDDCQRLFTEMRRLKIEQITNGPQHPPGMPDELYKMTATDFQRRWERELSELTQLSLRIDQAVSAHLDAEPPSAPLYTNGFLSVHIGTGERVRQKVRGEYIE